MNTKAMQEKKRVMSMVNSITRTIEDYELQKLKLKSSKDLIEAQYGIEFSWAISERITTIDGHLQYWKMRLDDMYIQLKTLNDKIAISFRQSQLHRENNRGNKRQSLFEAMQGKNERIIS